MGTRKSSSGVTRALLTVLSLGNIHHDKYLGNGGGFCPHQLPTCLAFSLGDIWAGGTLREPPPHLGFQARDQVCQGGFSVQGTGLPASSWCCTQHHRQLQCCSSCPAAHSSPNNVSAAQCHKAPGSSLHQQSYDMEARSHFCTKNNIYFSIFCTYNIHITITQCDQSITCPQLQSHEKRLYIKGTVTRK